MKASDTDLHWSEPMSNATDCSPRREDGGQGHAIRIEIGCDDRGIPQPDRYSVVTANKCWMPRRYESLADAQDDLAGIAR